MKGILSHRKDLILKITCLLIPPISPPLLSGPSGLPKDATIGGSTPETTDPNIKTDGSTTEATNTGGQTATYADIAANPELTEKWRYRYFKRVKSGEDRRITKGNHFIISTELEEFVLSQVDEGRWARKQVSFRYHSHCEDWGAGVFLAESDEQLAIIKTIIDEFKCKLTEDDYTAFFGFSDEDLANKTLEFELNNAVWTRHPNPLKYLERQLNVEEIQRDWWFLVNGYPKARQEKPTLVRLQVSKEFLRHLATTGWLLPFVPAKISCWVVGKRIFKPGKRAAAEEAEKLERAEEAEIARLEGSNAQGEAVVQAGAAKKSRADGCSAATAAESNTSLTTLGGAANTTGQAEATGGAEVPLGGRDGIRKPSEAGRNPHPPNSAEYRRLETLRDRRARRRHKKTRKTNEAKELGRIQQEMGVVPIKTKDDEVDEICGKIQFYIKQQKTTGIGDFSPKINELKSKGLALLGKEGEDWDEVIKERNAKSEMEKSTEKERQRLQELQLKSPAKTGAENQQVEHETEDGMDE